MSVDPPEHNARLKARLGAGYEFLSDERGELLNALDIREAHRSMTGKDTAIPTQYLLDREGVVRWVYRAESWRVRPHPREALDAIRKLPNPTPPTAAVVTPTNPAESGTAPDPARR